MSGSSAQVHRASFRRTFGHDSTFSRDLSRVVLCSDAPPCVWLPSSLRIRPENAPPSLSMLIGPVAGVADSAGVHVPRQDSCTSESILTCPARRISRRACGGYILEDSFVEIVFCVWGRGAKAGAAREQILSIGPCPHNSATSCRMRPIPCDPSCLCSMRLRFESAGSCSTVGMVLSSELAPSRGL
jgi:hypothetical protein